MKVKLNVSPLVLVDGIETQEVECVFGVLTIRKYFKQDEWLIFCPFWWEHLFNKKFTSSDEAVKFIEMRCEEYTNEVLEWVVLDDFKCDSSQLPLLGVFQDMDLLRAKRLMIFTSLLRTLDFVGHSRVDQCLGLFVKFEEKYPLIDGYTRTGKAIDHTNMKKFIEDYKVGSLDV